MAGSEGPAIDIAAPGDGIWCADLRRGGPPEVTHGIRDILCGADNRRGGGTLVGSPRPDNLLQQYANGPKLAEVFRTLLKSTCRTPQFWDTSQSGPGIVHVTKLLNAALPAADDVLGRDWSHYDATKEIDILGTQLGDPNENAYLSALAKWFNSTVADAQDLMDEFGTEISSLLAQVPGAFEEFKAVVEAEANSVAEEAQGAVDDAVDAVSDFCSDVVGTVMGWFS